MGALKFDDLFRLKLCGGHIALLAMPVISGQSPFSPLFSNSQADLFCSQGCSQAVALHSKGPAGPGRGSAVRLMSIYREPAWATAPCPLRCCVFWGTRQEVFGEAGAKWAKLLGTEPAAGSQPAGRSPAGWLQVLELCAKLPFLLCQVRGRGED